MNLFDVIEIAGVKGRIVAILPGFWVIVWKETGLASKVKIGSCSVRKVTP